MDRPDPAHADTLARAASLVNRPNGLGQIDQTGRVVLRGDEMKRREGIEFWNRHLEAWRGSRLTQEASCREVGVLCSRCVAGGWRQAYLRSRSRRQNQLVRPPRTGLGVPKWLCCRRNQPVVQVNARRANPRKRCRAGVAQPPATDAALARDRRLLGLSQSLKSRADCIRFC